MNFLKKIREKPEKTRKIILWSIVAPLGIIFAIWWIYIVKNNIKNISETPFLKTTPSPAKEIEGEIEEIKNTFNKEEIRGVIKKWGEITNEEETEKVKNTFNEEENEETTEQ